MVIDALAPESIYPAPGGLRAVCGPVALAVESSRIDVALLEDAREPVIWTVLEIDGDRLAHPVLVGFSSEERRGLYSNLRALPGIGRRSALAVLDCGENLDILRAVAGEDDEFFRQVPGLGAKRIAALIDNLRRTYDRALPRPLQVPVAAWVEARDSLQSQGLSRSEAEERLAGAEGDDAESLLGSIG